MADDSLLKKGLGEIGSLGKQLGQGVVAEAKKTAKATVAQVGLEGLADKDQTTNPEILKQAQDDNGKFQQADLQRAKDNEDLIKAMYGRTENGIQNPELRIKNSGTGEQNPDQNVKLNQGQRIAQSIAENNPEMTPEEVQKTAQLRQQLHSEYYQQLTNPPKQQEERPAEKIEREKQEERWELQKKEEEKPEPLAIKREQGKAEKRPGAG